MVLLLATDGGNIDVQVTLERDAKLGETVFYRELTFECVSLDVEAREKLLEIAENEKATIKKTLDSVTN